MSYDHGIVLCKQYKGTITGDKFVDIIENSFPQAFEDSIDPKGKRLLMDGCPRQNCKKAKQAISDVGGQIFSIPPRSPDLNPIENLFNLIVKKLKEEAIAKQITHETFDEFSSRVEKTMKEFPVQTINNIIDSMESRVDMVLKGKGNRIRY